jgi:hypothetical protein
LNRIILIDPNDFTTPYDLALAGAIAAEGRNVRLVGQVGELSRRQPLTTVIFSLFWPHGGERRLPNGVV